MNQKIQYFTLFGAIQFIILTIIAMFFYPSGYVFWTDHFSNLGLIYTYSIPKKLNLISFTLFVVTMILGGISFLPFWLSIPSKFKDKTETKIISWICLLTGVASSVFMILIAIFPADFFPFQHVFAAVGFFLLFTIAVLFHSLLILKNEKYGYGFSLIGFITTIFGTIYVVGLWTGMYGGIFGTLDAIIQKFAVYSFIIWMIIQVIQNKYTNQDKKL
ncbi:MAG: DUF998 domain-containing protein [Candidatus Lokiarchaeota archaeon]|nr:DUF998 domain-containing protein [Candidatus Lokiarchaeota archaeon]